MNEKLPYPPHTVKRFFSRGIAMGNRIASLLLIVAVLVLSCSKDENRKTIRFRAHTNGHPTTRTSFSGETATEGGVTKERIQWELGDLMRIYCPQACLLDDETVHESEYMVSEARADGLVSVATIVPYAVDNALQWGIGDHVFYALYPSPATTGMADNVSIGPGEEAGSVQVRCRIPATQNLAWEEKDGGWVGSPDMRFAYLYASATCAYASSVNLSFRPMYTVFEIQVDNSDYRDLSLESFSLSTTADRVAGWFIIDGMSGAESVSSTSTEQVITIPIGQVVPKNASLTITLFALPQDLDQLTISFTGAEIHTRSLALKYKNGDFLSFAANKKYRLYGLSFPEISDISAGGEGISWTGGLSVTDLATGESLDWTGGSGPVSSGGQDVSWGNSALDGATGETVGWDAHSQFGVFSIPAAGIGLGMGAVTYILTDLDETPVIADYTLMDVTSSDTGVLTIDGTDLSGHKILVTGVSAGSAVISATAVRGTDRIQAKGTVTVE